MLEFSGMNSSRDLINSDMKYKSLSLWLMGKQNYNNCP